MTGSKPNLQSPHRLHRIVTATPRTVRQVNRAVVLDLIRRHQPVSRASLSKYTGIHRSNVSVIVEGLLAEGLVAEARACPSGRGRVPFMLTLRDSALSVVGVNLRVATTTAILGHATGAARELFTFPTPSRPEDFVAQFARQLLAVLGSPGQNGFGAVRQLVVSVPGIVQGQNCAWLPALPKYSGFPLAERLERAAGVPAKLANNASLGALAELWLEERENRWLRDFVFLVIGDAGVGSGVILNRRLYAGHDSTFAGEFGHMVIDVNGPVCPCGRRGCWQLYVRDRATWRRYNPRRRFDPALFEAMMRAAEAGEPRARRALNVAARYLSVGLANIAAALNPEAVIIAGAITGAWKLIEAELGKTEFAASHPPVRAARLPLDHLFLHGAVCLGLGQLFESPALGAG